MFSFLYYKHDLSPIEDEVFDKLCVRLLAVYGTIKHRHKRLVSEDDLRAGSGFAIKKYPQRVRMAAQEWLRRNHLEMYNHLNNIE